MRSVGPLGLLIAAGFAGGALLASTSALATGHQGSPDSTFAAAYLDSDRCRVLMAQFGRTSATRVPDSAAAKLGVRGVELCQSGHFADGADSLAEAVRRVGEVPAEPGPMVRLH